jgi:uncharacterized membrane protein
MAFIGWSELIVILSMLFLIFLILIIYYFVKAMKRKAPSLQATTRICPHCERRISEETETKFCPYCGKKL